MSPPVIAPVRATPPDADSRRTANRASAAVFLVLAALTLGFQGAYVLLAERDVFRRDGYDVPAHYKYLQHVLDQPATPLSFRGGPAWRHFPLFYEVNALAARATSDVMRGIRIVWFLQAVMHVGILWIILNVFRRLLDSAWAVVLALALCATSPRVFFAPALWNQDEYVFFFAALCMYATVATAQDGFSASRLLAAALGAALGFAFKQSIVIPVAAMLLVFLLLPRGRAGFATRAAAIVLVLGVVLAINWPLFTTTDGLARLTSTSTIALPRYVANSQRLVEEYLTVSPGPLLRPEPIYRLVESPYGANSTVTCTYLYLFELYEYFQGPPRAWVNVLCVWSGTALVLLLLWRVASAVRELGGGPSAATLLDVYCAILVVLSVAGLLSVSLTYPLGWTGHPEYILAAYPAAAALVLRGLLALRDRVLLFRLLCAVAIVHLAMNLAVIVRTGVFKIRLGWA